MAKIRKTLSIRTGKEHIKASNKFFNYIKDLRICLCCGGKFKSQHKLNRICWNCKLSKSTEWKTDFRYTQPHEVNFK